MNQPRILVRSLRAESAAPCVAFAGAGGKTAALFQLAREFNSVWVSASAHLGTWQIPLADRHIILQKQTPKELPQNGVTLFSGEIEAERIQPVSENILKWLHDNANFNNLPFLIEADGSRQKPLKAPAAHEPPIPPFAEAVFVLAGLSALGQPLDEIRAHRAERFARLSNLAIGETLRPESIARVLVHPEGGLKNIPTGARRIALLNQADTPELQAVGGKMAKDLLAEFDAVLVGSLRLGSLRVFERRAAIILAAGEGKRFGRSKPLLDWKGKPFVRQIAETALRAALEPVVVVAGADAPAIESALAGLPVHVIHNPNYASGQSASIRCGLEALPANVGAAVFLLADQPQVSAEVISALSETHAREMMPILAPLVREEKRANPVLFDRVTFADLLRLQGDIGGRGIFHLHRVAYLPWHDEALLWDVDTPEDYAALREQS